MKANIHTFFFTVALSTNLFAYDWYEILKVKPNANAYETLGLSPKASAEDIKNAFHQLSLKYDPEKWIPDNALGPCKPTSISKEDSELVMKELISARNKLLSNEKPGKQQPEAFDKSKFKFTKDNLDWAYSSWDLDKARLDASKRDAQVYAQLALEHDDIYAMQYALSIGFDVNTHNAFFNQCPLGILVASYHPRKSLDMFQLILKSGVDISDYWNQQALALAAEKGFLNIVQLFYDAGFSMTGLEATSHHQRTTNVGDVAKECGHNNVWEWYMNLKQTTKQKQ